MHADTTDGFLALYSRYTKSYDSHNDFCLFPCILALQFCEGIYIHIFKSLKFGVYLIT